MTAKATSSAARYVDVAPALPLPATAPDTFTYVAETAAALTPRTRVVVPFGTRQVEGVVTHLHRRRPAYRTKKVMEVLPLQLTVQQLAFAQWLRRTMQGGLGYTLRLFFPPGGAVAVDATAILRGRSQANPKDTALLHQLQREPLADIEADDTKRTARIVALARAAAAARAQLLVVVPERWMVEPLVTALTHAAVASVSIHAGLSAQQQRNAWVQTHRQEVTAIVGTQKALFLPYGKLAGIVVVEEFLPTHKLWDQYPRLENVYGAEQLAVLHGCRVFYSTSSASLRLRRAITDGAVTVWHDNPLLPHARTISFSAEDTQAHRAVPDMFVQSLRRWRTAGQRVLVLHNTRGAWRAAICRRCQAVARCPTCAAAMTLPSAAEKTLHCRTCDTRRTLTERCSTCRSGILTPIGMGLEKLSDVLARTLPPRTRIRIADAAALHRKKYVASLHDAHVVIATSALFARVPQLTFDHIVYAFPEHTLLYPDFRSAERAYALLIRLQQRLANKSDQVLLLTRRPQLLKETLALAPTQFAARQLRERKRLGYPPYSDLVMLTVRAATTEKALTRARTLRSQVETRLAAQPDPHVQLRGPFNSLAKKRRGKAEAHVLLVGALEELASLYDKLPFDTADLAPARIL